MLPELQSYQDTRCGELSIEAPLAKTMMVCLLKSHLFSLIQKFTQTAKSLKNALCAHLENSLKIEVAVVEIVEGVSRGLIAQKDGRGRSGSKYRAHL